MHREELVEGLGGDEGVLRAGELQPHEERLGAADGEEDQRCEEVKDADLLVVDGGDPRVEAVLLLVKRVGDGGGGGHCRLPR